MADRQFTIADMIGAVNQESPSDFQTAFHSIVVDKIHDAINAKKIEIAQNYFNYEDESEEEQEEAQETDSNEGTTDEDTETTAGKDGQS